VKRIASFYSTTVGKKIAMAATGILLVGYVIGHMLGNLKIFQGPEKLNSYAEFLRQAGAPVLGHGEFLWMARIVLLAAVAIHVVASAQLTLQSRAARPVGYRNTPHEEFSYASRTMRWGGLIIGLFVVYHILHFTSGSVHGDFVPGDPYHNLVVGFQSWPVALAYIVAVVMLGFHLYHGVWSMTQTFGIDNERVDRVRRPLSLILAVLIVVGYVAVPISILAGWVT
jgi:succinate dehydrogenase / fumarate reductase cytochrome b subunit